MAFEKLLVYQKSVDFADRICQATEDFPRGYGFLVDQLNRASLSIAATGFDGIESRVPSGYTKGRHLRVSAFSRFFARSATTSNVSPRLKVPLSRRRETFRLTNRVGFPGQTRPKLSVVSVSLRVWVIGSCERSIGRNPHGCERQVACPDGGQSPSRQFLRGDFQDGNS
ncbi:MAG: four helix bundle protein [Planctomycetales bacterium]